MINWALGVYRDYYWFIYSTWRRGSDKSRRRNTFIAMMVWLPLPYFIPLLGVIFIFGPLGFGAYLNVSIIIILHYLNGAILTYFICIKNETYLEAKKRAESLEGKELKWHQEKIGYKFKFIQLFLSMAIGIPSFGLMGE